MVPSSPYDSSNVKNRKIGFFLFFKPHLWSPKDLPTHFYSAVFQGSNTWNTCPMVYFIYKEVTYRIQKIRIMYLSVLVFQFGDLPGSPLLPIFPHASLRGHQTGTPRPIDTWFFFIWFLMLIYDHQMVQFIHLLHSITAMASKLKNPWFDSL